MSIIAISRRTERLVTWSLFGLLVISSILTPLKVSRAYADLSAPSWWSGNCDVNNHTGSYGLGGSYNGVKACGPRPIGDNATDYTVHFSPGAWAEYEWECVELSMRYMYLAYGIAPYNAPGGKDVVGNYSGIALNKIVNNGTSIPTPGDIISEAATQYNSYGHTGVVSAVVVDGAGNGTVTLMEQNASSGGSTSITVTGKTLGSGVTGWLHNPNYAPPTSPDVDGDGVPDISDIAPSIPGPTNNRGIPDFSSRTTGDFNGDGKADVAEFYTYPNDQVKVFEFLANASGGYAAPTQAWDSGVGNWVGANLKPFAGDFNGDSKADLGVFYGYQGSQTKLLTFMANSSGSFNPPTQAWDSGVGNWDWSHTLQVAGDFNGDGKTDVGVFYDYNNNQTKLFTFLANSTGGLNTPTLAWDSGVGNWDWASMKPFAGDFNGDSKVDIGTFYGYMNSQTKLLTFMANSSGFNTPTLAWDSGVGNWAWSSVLQVAGDFNGDSKADVGVFYAYPNSQTKLLTFYANSTGGLNTPTLAWDSGVGNWSWSSMKPYTGDINGDSKKDIGVAYAYPNNQVKMISFIPTAPGFPSWPSLSWDSGVGNWSWASVNIP